MSGLKSSGLPIGCQVTSGRSNSAVPSAKPSAGSVNESDGDRPGAVRRERHHAPARDRLALEGAREAAVFGVLGLRLSAPVRHARRTITTGQLSGGRSSHGHGPGAPGFLGPGGIALGVRLGGARDHVGEHGDGLEVAERGEPRQPERVQAVAGEQRQVRIVRAHDAPLAVVLQVALADRLDQQARTRRPRSPATVRVAGGSVGVDDGVREQAALGAQLGGQGAQHTAPLGVSHARRSLTRSPRTPPRRPRACA